MKKKKKTKVKTIKFYEVYHEGPMGPSTMGFFQFIQDAQLKKLEWDLKHTYYLDLARIQAHTMEWSDSKRPAKRLKKPCKKKCQCGGADGLGRCLCDLKK